MIGEIACCTVATQPSDPAIENFGGASHARLVQDGRSADKGEDADIPDTAAPDGRFRAAAALPSLWHGG